MESLPHVRLAGAQNPDSPTDLTSSSGLPSVTSTRETSPASLVHHLTPTTFPTGPMNLSSANSDRKQLEMDSSREQSLADKKAPRNDAGKMMDTHVPVQELDGNASLYLDEMIHNSNASAGQTTTGHWQNVAAQNMIAVGGSGRAGRQSRNAINHQTAEAAQNFGTAFGLRPSHDTLAEGSFGNSGQPYNNAGHQKSSDTRGSDGFHQDCHVLRGQGARHSHNTHESTLAALNLSNGHRNGTGAKGESYFGFQASQGTLRARTPCSAPLDTLNEERESQSALSDCDLHSLPNAHSTAEEGHLALGMTWNHYNVNKSVAAAEDLCFAPVDVYDASGKYDPPHQGLLPTRTLPQRLVKNQPVPGHYHDPTNVDNTGGSSRIFQRSHKDILAAQFYHKAQLDTCDARGQKHLPSGGRLSAQDPDNNQNSTLATQSLHDALPNVYNAWAHGDLVSPKSCDAQGNILAPQSFRRNAPPDVFDATHQGLASRNLCDAHGNVLAPQNFRRDTPNVFDEAAHLSIKLGSSDCVTRYLPTSHSSATTSAHSVSSNSAIVQRHHSNKFSSGDTPGFSSPISSIFGSHDLSGGASPYVAITSPATTDLLRNNASNISAASQRLEPLADSSPSKDPSPSISTASSSSSNTYTATMFPPRGIVVTESDMECAMAYCFDRGNGQYTRLVPVDVLPFSLKDIPARVSSDEGMIVLPVPRMVGPDGQPANVRLIPHVAGNNVTPPTSPTGTAQGGSTDPVQNRIDNIVAAAPNTISGPVVLARSIAAANGTGRREKVYCDKWIHDGTCAFTQQGCKFRHDMPMDKETQQSLGLFHGLPAWYRKQEAERVMHLDDRPVPLGGGAVAYFGGAAGGRFGHNGGVFGAGVGAASRAQNWRRIEAPPTPGTAGDDEGSSPLPGGAAPRVGLGRGRAGSRVANYRTNNNFGPIGPPSQSTGALSGGLGANRRRTNTAASFEVFSAGANSVRESQRDDAAPRDGVRIGNDRFGALEDYVTAANANSDKGKGADENRD